MDEFYWKQKDRDVEAHCEKYMICRQRMDDRRKPSRSSQPLRFSSRIWGSVSKDFLTCLPLAERTYDCISTYVDRFSRLVYFMSNCPSNTEICFFDSFVQEIFRRHEVPDLNTSNHYHKIPSWFWSRLTNHCWIWSLVSPSIHARIDETSEIINCMGKSKLCFYCSPHQKKTRTHFSLLLICMQLF